MSRAWNALSAARFTVSVMSSSDAAVSSRLAACCSVRRERSSAAAAISLRPRLMASVLEATAMMVNFSFSIASLKSSRI